jgi:phosphoribosylanthranilate isomerase
MFRVKICGITCLEDALVAAQAGADAVGLNFYSGSKRCVSLEEAAAIAAGLPKSMLKVGVFVNAGVGAIRRAHAAVGFGRCPAAVPWTLSANTWRHVVSWIARLA